MAIDSNRYYQRINSSSGHLIFAAENCFLFLDKYNAMLIALNDAADKSSKDRFVILVFIRKI